MNAHFSMTLVDLSPEMLSVSRDLNPECEHIEDDMRTVRLDHEFDAVFIHDAIVYMTSKEDLAAAVETAFVHTRPGGVALFCPDHTKDNFVPRTDHGGYDDGDKGLRYLEWSWDPDPDDSTCITDYAYLLHDEDGSTRALHDRHVEGLFSEVEWAGILEGAGFVPSTLPFIHTEVPEGSVMFLGHRPKS